LNTLKVTKAYLILSILTLLIFRSYSSAEETRGLKVVLKETTEVSRNFYGASHALIIGINDYRDFPALQYAISDGESFGKLLVELYNFPKENVLHLFDNNATKRSIMTSITTISSQLKKDDRLIVYFAGHGLTLEDESTGEDTGVILAFDSTSEDTANSAILFDELTRQVSTATCKHIMFIFDACYSGFATTRAAMPSAKGKTDEYIGVLTSKKVKQVITAGGKGEQVIERAGHGVFTDVLLSGLSGLADINFDNAITGNELFYFIKKRVSQASSYRQMPQYACLEGEGDIVFVPNKSFHDIKEYSLEEQLKKDEFEGLYYQGCSLIDKKDYVGAEKLLRSALAIYPEHTWAKARYDFLKKVLMRPRTITDKLGQGMLLVAGGNFVMGSDEAIESPKRTVFVGDYYMDMCEVTVSNYMKFLNSTTEDIEKLIPKDWESQVNNPTKAATGVSYAQANSFANWIGKRLPTEEEWEKAVRGTKGKLYSWGNEWQETQVIGYMNAKGHALDASTQLGDTSEYGIHNLLGNVREWVSDTSKSYADNSVPVDQFGAQFAVVRGGDFKGKGFKRFRASYRTFRHPDLKYETIGFRCVQDVTD